MHTNGKRLIVLVSGLGGAALIAVLLFSASRPGSAVAPAAEASAGQAASKAQRSRWYSWIPGVSVDSARGPAANAAPPAAPAAAEAPPADNGTGLDAKESRKQIVGAIVASGPTNGEWARKAPAVFDAFESAVPPALTDKVQFNGVRCYEKACIAEVAYDDMEAFEKTNSLFLGAEAFEGWAGPKGRTAVDVGESGKVEVTWMLMNPGRQVQLTSTQ